MKKIELIELIQEKYNGGSLNPDIYKKLHPLVLEKYISMGLNVIFYQIFKQDQSGLDAYARWYREQDVKEENGVKYLDLPVDLVQMPNGTTSVREINLTEDNLTSLFTYCKSSEISRKKRSGAVTRMGKTLFTVTNRIEFENIDPLIEKVNVLMITPFSDLSEDEEIVIPQGQDKVLMDLVFDFIKQAAEKDNVTDNK